MSQNQKKSAEKRLSLWIGILLVLTLVVSACAVEEPQTDQAAQSANPLVLVTNIVVQIVATPTVTPVPPPEEETIPVVNSISNGGWDPFAVPIYYPLRGCAASRLHPKDVAFVGGGAGVIGIHYSSEIGYAPIFRHLQPGEVIDIVAGPWCENGTVVWKVATSDKYVGYTPEGDGSTYWLLPMPPTTDSVLTKEELKISEFIRPGETVSTPKKSCR